MQRRRQPMPQWIIELLYPIAVFICLIIGLISSMILWFLITTSYNMRNIIPRMAKARDVAFFWLLDKLFGCKGEKDGE